MTLVKYDRDGRAHLFGKPLLYPEGSFTPTPEPMRFTRRPIEAEIITFEELVEIGLAQNGAHVRDGVPWSFNINSLPVTHENDDCYIVPTKHGPVHFKRGDLLVIAPGELYPITPEDFDRLYNASPVADTVAARVLAVAGRMPGPYAEQFEKMRDELARRFKYHPPKGDQASRYSALRAWGEQLAERIVEHTPPSREQSLALTHLENALFYANAAIARNE